MANNDLVYGTCLYSDDIVKMFPVSFERTRTGKDGNPKMVHDRLISEENLVDWFRGVTGDSCDLDKNSPYSYVVSEYVDTGNFRFILGGYHVELLLSGIDNLVKNIGADRDIYALLKEIDNNDGFRHVYNGDSSNSTDDPKKSKFYAVQFVVVSPGSEPSEKDYPKGTYYRLHILTYNSKHTDGKTPKYTIPPESRRYSFTVDGGVV